MAYTLLSPQPPARDADLPDDQAGPGLYAGEIAVDLGDGVLAAISVASTWLENGAGAAVTGDARWINADGQTHLTDTGQHVETHVSLSGDAGFVAAAGGVEALLREGLLLLMGETIEAPAILLPDQDRLQASIRHAVALVGQIKAAPAPAALLGLAAAA